MTQSPYYPVLRALKELEDLWAERDRLKCKLADWFLALQSLTPGGSEFQSPETCEAYVRERLHHGQDLAKEVVRLKREIRDLRRWIREES